MTGARNDVLAEVLELFLQDMKELDCLQSVAATEFDQASQQGQEEDRRTPKHRTKGSRTWLRRKEELVQLRQQTHEMESHVALLQSLRAAKRRELGLAPESAEELQLRMLALIERKRHQAAQLQNLDLKAQLQSHLQILAALQAQVVSASFHKQSTGLDCMPPLFQVNSPKTISMLENRLERRTLELETILNDLHLAPTTMDAIRVQVYNGEGNSASVMQCNYAQVYPFNRAVTFNAAWSVAEEDGIPQKLHFRVVKESQNVSIVDSRFVFQGGSITVDILSIRKRFVIPGGSVLLSESISEWSGIQEGSNLWRNTTHESVYVVARDYPDYRKSYRKPACQVNAVVRSEADQNGTFSDARTSALNPTSDILLPSFHELIESQLQVLENMLMDSARDN
ncbi:hypothetical protein PHYBOEH_011119 [Phytophthora boehmeriae]|uniref:M96 mating-specific protein family n=1 Tax=Phytophthora boehmeriae TaxID=109152 RepID=A0A8T1VLW8_9STRA|nr:hypothetical protein PHYBOEH_011119 [Phytophthora boehmeriae]